MEFSTNTSDWTTKVAKPVFRKLGPRLGRDMPKVKAALTALTTAEVEKLQEVGEVTVEGYTLRVADGEIEVSFVLLYFVGWLNVDS